MQYLFSDQMLDTDSRELCRGADRVAVEPQVFDLLVYLVKNRDRVVSKDDLIVAIWDGRIVSESTLTSRINAARKSIGDTGRDQNLIRTISRKGFRFVGTLRSQPAGHGSPDNVGHSADELREGSRSALSPLDRPAVAAPPLTHIPDAPHHHP